MLVYQKVVKTSGIHGVSQKPKNVGTLNVNIRPFQWWSIEILDTRVAGEQLSSLGLLNPQCSTYHFVDITPTSEYIEQIRIIIAIIHYSSYGKRDMWFEKITTWSTWLATRDLPTIWPCCVQFWSATAHGINTTSRATVLKMVWKSAVFLMIIKSDQSISVQPIECWNLCGERWRKHLGHSAKTEKEQ